MNKAAYLLMDKVNSYWLGGDDEALDMLGRMYRKYLEIDRSTMFEDDDARNAMDEQLFDDQAFGDRLFDLLYEIETEMDNEIIAAGEDQEKINSILELRKMNDEVEREEKSS